MPDSDKLLSLLRCPYCHTKLDSFTDISVSCLNCNEEYKIHNNVPIMISSSKQAAIDKEISSWHSSELLPKFLNYDTIQHIKSPEPFKWFKRDKILAETFKGMKPDGFYIDIGGTGNLSHPAIYCANLTIDSKTHLVCDGQYLPFEDNSVDGLFILLVLEHVPNPFAIADEIKRVLKKGGFVFATLPFLQVLHENPKDYYRFTPDGIRNVFDGLIEEKLDVASGPTGSLIWILKEYLALLCPFSNKGLIYVSVREFLGWLLYPLIYLDYYLLTKKRAKKMASYFFYIGRK